MNTMRKAVALNADRHASFTLVSGIGLYGGFSGRETRREQRNWKKNPTVLAGEIGDPGDMADNVCHVVTGSDDAVLDGFTIQDGYAVPAEGEADGSGCLVAVPDAASDMETLRIVTNIKDSSGAGLLNVHAGTVTRNCLFTNNYASKGGAVYNMVTRSWDPSDMSAAVIGESPSFENCTFENNQASDRGGAVYIDYGAWPSFDACTLSGNASTGNGGGVYVDNNASQLAVIEARFTSCDLVNKLSGQRGGAFSIYEGTVFLNHSTITENFAAAGGGGIALDYMGSYVNMDDSSTITKNTSTSGENDIDDDRSMSTLPPPMEM